MFPMRQEKGWDFGFWFCLPDFGFNTGKNNFKLIEKITEKNWNFMYVITDKLRLLDVRNFFL